VWSEETTKFQAQWKAGSEKTALFRTTEMPGMSKWLFSGPKNTK
jgi:hypothetical protein